MTKKIVLLPIMALVVGFIGYNLFKPQNKPNSEPITPSASALEPGIIQDGNYPADLNASTIEWRAKKVVVNSEHYGSVNLKSGELEFANNGFLKSGQFVIDLTTIKDSDLPDDAKPKLEGHLKSADFFDVTKYSEAKLIIKKVEVISTINQVVSYSVTADLTVKDKTNEVVFPVAISGAGQTFIANADIKIDRTLWDLRYGSGKFFDDLGDKVIDDWINFKVVIKN